MDSAGCKGGVKTTAIHVCTFQPQLSKKSYILKEGQNFASQEKERRKIPMLKVT